jgi:hypothetical protein
MNWGRLPKITDIRYVHVYIEVRVKVRMKVQLSLCFNWARRHEGVLWKWRYTSTYSLTLELDGGEWVALGLCHFNPRESAPGTYCIGGWVGPRAGLTGSGGEEKNFQPLPGLEPPDHPARSAELYHWTTPALVFTLREVWTQTFRTQGLRPFLFTLSSTTHMWLQCGVIATNSASYLGVIRFEFQLEPWNCLRFCSVMLV